VTTPFVQFELERWMSVWEPRVQTNLCDSGVAPVSAQELLKLSGGDLKDLGAIPLTYGIHNGSEPLREAIARLYRGATVEHVLVTSGSAEAVFLLCWSLIRPGDRIVIPTPAYRQASGIVASLGAEVVPLPLSMEHGWEPEPDAIRACIQPGTRLVIITNPHNPTGQVLSPDTRATLVARAAEVGAWLIVDEIYLGAELDGATPASMWNGYERLIVTSGFSKTYGLPGLRIGWIVGPPRVITEAWMRHDYTVLAPNILGDYLAQHALAVRERLQARGRETLAHNWPLLEQRLKRIAGAVDGGLHWRAPRAGGIVFIKYDHALASEQVADRLRDGWSLLVAPGDHFGCPHHIRLGIGGAPEHYPDDLDVLERGLRIVLA
jgi:aspartate/methionine/tyrosine aminotransferase